jgi:hypothetical protein
VRVTPLKQWTQIDGIGDLEGPYPSLNILTRSHWCCGPVSRAKLTAEEDGMYLFLIEYQNVWVPSQRLSIFIDDIPVKEYVLRRTHANDTRVLSFRADLAAGPHALTMQFSHWIEPTPREQRNWR